MSTSPNQVRNKLIVTRNKHLVFWSFISRSKQCGVHIRILLVYHHCIINYWRIQYQLDKLTNDRQITIIAMAFNPMPISRVGTVIARLFSTFFKFEPIFKAYFGSTAGVNPSTSFCLNTHPKFPKSKGDTGFSIDLVVERLGLGFNKSSSFESIHCCRFTEFLGRSVIFCCSTETIGNIYY